MAIVADIFVRADLTWPEIEGFLGDMARWRIFDVPAHLGNVSRYLEWYLVGLVPVFPALLKYLEVEERRTCQHGAPIPVSWSSKLVQFMRLGSPAVSFDLPKICSSFWCS